MQSLGVRLRLERERQKIGIDKIAEDTRISKRYLEAIEADDQSSLPGEFFYRAFVRQYSKSLGWNPDEVEKQINLVSSLPASEPVGNPAPVRASLSLNSEPQISTLRETLKESPLRSAQDDRSSKAWMLFAALVFIGCIAYFGWRNFIPAPAEEAQSAPPRVEQQPQASTMQPPIMAPIEKTPAPPTPTAPVETPKVSEAQVTPGAGKFALTIRAKQTTWIRITADGAKVFGGTLDAGQERTFNAANVELIVGNAGTLDVIYNGKPLAYGNLGEVKTLLMNPEGWKFKAKPPPEVTAPPAASTTGNAAAVGSSPRAF